MRENGSNLLSWQVTQEVNLAQYEVERSLDNINFEKIGSVTPYNLYNVKRTYQLTDSEPAALSYYRLKSVDQDGHFGYSQVVRLKRNNSTDGNAYIYPNPAQSELSFVYKATIDDTKLYVEVLDVTGRVVMKQDEIVNAGSTTMTLNISSLANGNYIIRYNDLDAADNGFVKFTKTTK